MSSHLLLLTPKRSSEQSDNLYDPPTLEIKGSFFRDGKRSIKNRMSPQSARNHLSNKSFDSHHSSNISQDLGKNQNDTRNCSLPKIESVKLVGGNQSYLTITPRKYLQPLQTQQQISHAVSSSAGKKLEIDDIMKRDSSLTQNVKRKWGRIQRKSISTNNDIGSIEQLANEALWFPVSANPSMLPTIQSPHKNESVIWRKKKPHRDKINEIKNESFSPNKSKLIVCGLSELLIKRIHGEESISLNQGKSDPVNLSQKNKLKSTKDQTDNNYENVNSNDLGEIMNSIEISERLEENVISGRRSKCEDRLDEQEFLEQPLSIIHSKQQLEHGNKRKEKKKKLLKITMAEITEETASGKSSRLQETRDHQSQVSVVPLQQQQHQQVSLREGIKALEGLLNQVDEFESISEADGKTVDSCCQSRRKDLICLCRKVRGDIGKAYSMEQLIVPIGSVVNSVNSLLSLRHFRAQFPFHAARLQQHSSTCSKLLESYDNCFHNGISQQTFKVQ